MSTLKYVEWIDRIRLCGSAEKEVELHHFLRGHTSRDVEKKRRGVVRHKDLKVKPNLPPARSDRSASSAGGATHR